MTYPQLKWNLHCPPYSELYPFQFFLISTHPPDHAEKAQVLATEAANGQMFAWQANHLATCFNSRGKKKHPKNRWTSKNWPKNGKMSLMFPALFIQIRYTNGTECIAFAKFSIQMTSWFMYIAMQKPLHQNNWCTSCCIVCFSITPRALYQRKQPKQPMATVENPGIPGRKNRQDFFEIFLPPSPQDGCVKLLSSISWLHHDIARIVFTKLYICILCCIYSPSPGNCQVILTVHCTNNLGSSATLGPVKIHRTFRITVGSGRLDPSLKLHVFGIQGILRWIFCHLKGGPRVFC